MTNVALGRRVALLLIVVAVAGFAVYVSMHPMDFRVYHYGARGVFDGTRPVYGPTSGLGWPMHYRYPPLFLFLFAPFAWLPLGLSAAVWMILKAIVLCLLVATVYKHPFVDRRYLVPILLAGPYVIEDFRYGNAQFFVFALTAACLLVAPKRPVMAAGALALGIAIKIWPVFFVPYLILRNQYKVAACALIITVILLLLPSSYFGFGGNLSLLAQWFHQEFAIQNGPDEIWFPSQSLRGVMMRYLTAIDYSQVPDSNYPQVNLAGWTPSSVKTVWMFASGVIYLAFLWMVFRSRQTEGWIESSLGFCLLAILEPFTQKYALVVLLWPAIVAGRIVDEPRLRYLVYAAIALAIVQPVTPGAANQRLLQALGFDFAGAALLAIAFTTYSLFRYESLTCR